MKSNIVKQALYEMRRQPVAASVTIIGTALAIFLLMTVVMINSVATIPIPPESNRDNILHGRAIHIIGIGDFNGSTGSGNLNYDLARRLYGGLEGIDTLTYYNNDYEYDRVDVKFPGQLPQELYRKTTDEGFWAVFNHKLLAGKYYDRAAVDAHADVAILTESAARKTTGADPAEAVGRTINIDHKPFTIVGVIADHSPLANHAFGEVFMPLRKENLSVNWGIDLDNYMGGITVAMTLKPGYSREDIQRQLKERYDKLNAELEPKGIQAVYHEQPFTARLDSQLRGTDSTPSTEEADRRNILLFLILLIIPAINMSSMTQSRLIQRRAETGVKRTYGATRSRIILDILSENLIITIIGGILGLILSIAAAWLLSDTLFKNITIAVDNLHLPWQILINWHLFGLALLGCFVLNILSAGIPAWRASRVSPVEALRS